MLLEQYDKVVVYYADGDYAVSLPPQYKDNILITADNLPDVQVFVVVRGGAGAGPTVNPDFYSFAANRKNVEFVTLDSWVNNLEVTARLDSSNPGKLLAVNRLKTLMANTDWDAAGTERQVKPSALRKDTLSAGTLASWSQSASITCMDLDHALTKYPRLIRNSFVVMVEGLAMKTVGGGIFLDMEEAFPSLVSVKTGSPMQKELRDSFVTSADIAIARGPGETIDFPEDLGRVVRGQAMEEIGPRRAGRGGDWGDAVFGYELFQLRIPKKMAGGQAEVTKLTKALSRNKASAGTILLNLSSKAPMPSLLRDKLRFLGNFMSRYSLHSNGAIIQAKMYSNAAPGSLPDTRKVFGVTFLETADQFKAISRSIPLKSAQERLAAGNPTTGDYTILEAYWNALARNKYIENVRATSSGVTFANGEADAVLAALRDISTDGGGKNPIARKYETLHQHPELKQITSDSDMPFEVAGHGKYILGYTENTQKGKEVKTLWVRRVGDDQRFTPEYAHYSVHGDDTTHLIAPATYLLEKLSVVKRMQYVNVDIANDPDALGRFIPAIESADIKIVKQLRGAGVGSNFFNGVSAGSVAEVDGVRSFEKDGILVKLTQDDTFVVRGVDGKEIVAKRNEFEMAAGIPLSCWRHGDIRFKRSTASALCKLDVYQSKLHPTKNVPPKPKPPVAASADVPDNRKPHVGAPVDAPDNKRTGQGAPSDIQRPAVPRTPLKTHIGGAAPDGVNVAIKGYSEDLMRRCTEKRDSGQEVAKCYFEEFGSDIRGLLVSVAPDYSWRADLRIRTRRFINHEYDALLTELEPEIVRVLQGIDDGTLTGAEGSAIMLSITYNKLRADNHISPDITVVEFSDKFVSSATNSHPLRHHGKRHVTHIPDDAPSSSGSIHRHSALYASIDATIHGIYSLLNVFLPTNQISLEAPTLESELKPEAYIKLEPEVAQGECPAPRSPFLVSTNKSNQNPQCKPSEKVFEAIPETCRHVVAMAAMFAQDAIDPKITVSCKDSSGFIRSIESSIPDPSISKTEAQCIKLTQQVGNKDVTGCSVSVHNDRMKITGYVGDFDKNTVIPAPPASSLALYLSSDSFMTLATFIPAVLYSRYQLGVAHAKTSKKYSHETADLLWQTNGMRPEGCHLTAQKIAKINNISAEVAQGIISKYSEAMLETLHAPTSGIAGQECITGSRVARIDESAMLIGEYVDKIFEIIFMKAKRSSEGTVDCLQLMPILVKNKKNMVDCLLNKNKDAFYAHLALAILETNTKTMGALGSVVNAGYRCCNLIKNILYNTDNTAQIMADVGSVLKYDKSLMDVVLGNNTRVCNMVNDAIKLKKLEDVSPLTSAGHKIISLIEDAIVLKCEQDAVAFGVIASECAQDISNIICRAVSENKCDDLETIKVFVSELRGAVRRLSTGVASGKNDAWLSTMSEVIDGVIPTDTQPVESRSILHHMCDALISKLTNMISTVEEEVIEEQHNGVLEQVELTSANQILAERLL